MSFFSDKDAKTVANRIRKMLRQSKTREQLNTTKKYFYLFKKNTMRFDIIHEIEKLIKKHENKLFLL